jgi:hypothetical protein
MNENKIVVHKKKLKHKAINSCAFK